MPNVLPPPRPVSPDYVPSGGRWYSVKSGDTWSTLAHAERITPWNLIDYNFPGIYEVFAGNFQLATRYVNWYLKEYVGCEASNGPNYIFSSGIKKGQGVYAYGHIYLPPRPYFPPQEPSCVAIDIPSIDLPLEVMGALKLAKVSLPKRARCLWKDPEIDVAKTVFGESLHYHLIYMSDGVGGAGRPFTVALPLDRVWIVVLNMGPYAYHNPGVDKGTLIHELVHAWQSQHHPKPWQYMLNCLQSQAAADAATVTSHPVANELIKSGYGVRLPRLGDADAYSYVPTGNFGDFAGEQIAQQIEDSFTNNCKVPARLKPKVDAIARHVKTVPAGMVDPLNVQSLSRVRFAYEEQKDVVWYEKKGCAT